MKASSLVALLVRASTWECIVLQFYLIYFILHFIGYIYIWSYGTFYLFHVFNSTKKLFQRDISEASVARAWRLEACRTKVHKHSAEQYALHFLTSFVVLAFIGKL
ncbi:hypothetical protein GDO78_020088 [Eleutherodactylus coqui]|uniref:Uncharacterized protein n=1 Tax=Eleutherodactylus coqui TaxID=57060 RepID=A0A8J6BDY2_ELECQ|nr:hypothetical protein GDO78_020088 [Eleutherodactylus coqui]